MVAETHLDGEGAEDVEVRQAGALSRVMSVAMGKGLDRRDVMLILEEE